MTIGIKALVGAISREELVSELGCYVWVCLEEVMVGFHVEDVSEQFRGRDLDPLAKGQGRKDKSHDAITSLDGQVSKLELAMEDTKEGLDLLEQSIEKDIEDLRGQIQELQERMQGSLVLVVSHEEFMKVLNMLASLESRVEALTKHVEARGEKVRHELAEGDSSMQRAL